MTGDHHDTAFGSRLPRPVGLALPRATDHRQSLIVLLRRLSIRQMYEQVHLPLLLAVAVVSATLIISRRPDALFNPQFWAEDGAVFYADAYNKGVLTSLVTPYQGYFVTVQRLGALIALVFPLAWSPFVLNLLGLILQVLPAVFLWTRRFDRLIPNLHARALLFFLYVAVPNSSEIDVTLTNSQWHLALLAFMVLVAAPPRGWWRIFDLFVLLLAGMSGPFSILLLPVALIYWGYTRTRETLFHVVIIGFTAAVQGLAIALFAGDARSRVSIKDLGALLHFLPGILSGQIFLGGTIGMRGYAVVFGRSWWLYLYSWAPIAITCAGAALMLIAAWRGPKELHLFLLYGALVLVGALASPEKSSGVDSGPAISWLYDAFPGLGARYEYLLILGFFVSLVSLLRDWRQRWVRWTVPLILALVFMVGIPLDWRYPAYANLQFGKYTAQFEHVPTGSTVIIPINPSPWVMELVKH